MGDELYLIDGNSLAYRAFFALPESISTADGRPTNAIYGFASMLVKLLVEHRPKAVIVAWDAGMSGREVDYTEYKSQRKPRPDLLKEQWPNLAPLVEAFGMTNVRVEGYEADDVIATIAREAEAQGIQVMVVTGDRDAYQLVSDGIRVMSTSRGVTDTKTYDREAVIERYGVPPEKVTDLMGLRGDTSDNIPGVPGIGDKTAAQLLQQFGSLENVLESIDEISGAKRKQNLTEFAEDARMSKRLATLVYDVDHGIDIDACMGVETDLTRLRDFAREFELRQVVARLEEGLGEEEVPESAPAVELEMPVEDVASAGDVTGDPVSLALASTTWAACNGERVARGPRPANLAGLGAEWAGRGLIVHDAKSMGGPRGGLLSAAPVDVVHDTMLAAYVIDPTRRVYELSDLAEAEGLSAAGSRTPAEEPADEQLSLGEEPVDADPAEEAQLVWELAQRQREQLTGFGLEHLMEAVELPLLPVLAAMERDGVRIDLDRLAKIGAGMGVEIDALETEIWALAGREFTIGSPQQLSAVLFEELGLSRKRRGKTGFSTDARVLSQIREEHEIVPKVERWRELTKLKNTYLDALPTLVDPETSRIHTTLRQAATTTGRLSSVNPNLQNIPIRSEIGRPIRGCFTAAPGNVLISADYNQVELRILAHVAEDEALREIFASGGDVHAATAAEVLALEEDAVGVADRSKAKMVNYGIAYGLSAFGLADRLQIPQDEAAAYIARYFERFPSVKRWIDLTVVSADEEGEVKTLLGRRRPIPELRARRRQDRQLGERLAVNTVIQGTAADIIKLAMVASHRTLTDAGLQTRLILQIHDELLFEGPEEEAEAAAALIEEQMRTAYDLDPALAVDVGTGPDWLAAK